MPGAYRSITKIDFTALDTIQVKVTGIYGSKTEIVRFLCETGSVSPETVELLLLSEDAHRPSQAELRSGMYLLIPPNLNSSLNTTAPPPMVYALYWPEDTTWNDSVTGGVRRNRVTFMRYLTRLSDQICALISPEHSTSLIWKDLETDEVGEQDDEGSGSDGDNDDRFFKFEVIKDDDQGESARLCEGFKFNHRGIIPSVPIANDVGLTTTPVTSLLAGQTRSGFMTSKVIPQQENRRRLSERFNPLRFVRFLKDRRIELAETIDESALDVLMTQGLLSDRMPEIDRDHRTELSRISRHHASALENAQANARKDITKNQPLLERDVKVEILAILRGRYPMLPLLFESERDKSDEEDSFMTESNNYLEQLRSLYPKVKSVCNGELEGLNVNSIDTVKFRNIKRRFMTVCNILARGGDRLTRDRTRTLVQSILSDAEIRPKREDKALPGFFGVVRFLSLVLLRGGEKPIEGLQEDICAGDEQSDTDFLDSVAQSVIKEPLLKEAADELYQLARAWAEHKLSSFSRTLVERIVQAQKCSYDEAEEFRSKRKQADERLLEFHRFRNRVRAALIPVDSESNFMLEHVRQTGSDIFVTGHDVDRKRSVMEHHIWPMELTESDTHKMLENAQYIPAPRVPRHAISFELPIDNHIHLAQLLGSERLLLVVDTPTGTSIWLGPQSRILTTRPIKNLRSCRQYVLAVDEKKRLIAFVTMDNERCILHVFVMDETLTSLSGRGSRIDITPWYQDGPPSIRMATFFPGTEELCLVEHSGRARIYSFIARGFRPAAVQLPQSFDYVQSAHDASALLVVQGPSDGSRTIWVHHRSSWGTDANEHGIALTLPAQFTSATSFSATSLSQQNISLLALLPMQQTVESVSMQISHPEAEYQFRNKGERSGPSTSIETQHNSLIDCFSEVWGRYPIVSAIKRSVIYLQ
ncbi:hypothetical protein FRB98_006120 [Tulasnella sp. 332]|nr:hypothetical protein FRB98_006120 [Tulasnella sp. 332]